MRTVTVGDYQIGPGQPLALIAGPCVIESEGGCRRIAERLKVIAHSAGFPLLFKASFDKANRTSVDSYRGPGLEQGLAILDRVRRHLDLPVLTDIHTPDQAAVAAEAVDVLQVPAFLSRQTDVLVAAGETGKPVNIKKGQFLAPEDLAHAVRKVESTGNKQVLLTERGTTFGYHNLVVDFRSFRLMADIGCPVVFDATHSVQLPGGAGAASGGQREFVPLLARAAAAAGVHALFLEVHDDPEHALSDGPNMWPLDELSGLLRQLRAVHEAALQFADEGSRLSHAS